jgi:hypothetical protein
MTETQPPTKKNRVVGYILQISGIIMMIAGVVLFIISADVEEGVLALGLIGFGGLLLLIGDRLSNGRWVLRVFT